MMTKDVFRRLPGVAAGGRMKEDATYEGRVDAGELSGSTTGD